MGPVENVFKWEGYVKRVSASQLAGSRVMLPCEMLKGKSSEMAGNASRVVNNCMNYSYLNYVKLIFNGCTSMTCM